MQGVRFGSPQVVPDVRDEQMRDTRSAHMDTHRARTRLKRWLARSPSRAGARGATVLIYHRVGGGTSDERDLAITDFTEQLDRLAHHRVVSLDDAIDTVDAGDDRPSVVLTFDDGFADVHEHAWPLLRARGLPFTLYLATAYVGGKMRWQGSTARAAGTAMDWDQLAQLAASPLCTIANHTHTHARPEALTVAELDRCNEVISGQLGLMPQHFAYPWGIPVPRLDTALRDRFRSASTGQVGRNLPGGDPLRLRRIPVRRTDPIEFFDAKLTGSLGPERTYAAIVAGAKRVGLRA